MIESGLLYLWNFFQISMKRFSLMLCCMMTAIFSCIHFTSCIDDGKKDDKQVEENDSIEMERKTLLAQRYYMKQYYTDFFPIYYWYDDVEKRVSRLSYNNFSSIFDYFDATLYSEDHWSWMMTGDEYVALESGDQTGTYGFSLGQALEYYDDYSIRVRFIYPGSPLEQYGVTRGWELTHLDSIPVMDLVATGRFYDLLYKDDQSFTFKDLKGETHSFVCSPASSLFVHSSLRAQVFRPGDYPGITESVGYFLYMSFMAGDFLKDIDDAMSMFKEAGVRKLILDLRYNGGGSMLAADALVNYLAPESANNKVYYKTIHNRQLSMLNDNDTVHRKKGSLDLDALYIIGGGNTASASEVTINGLKPFMNVYLVGDTTYGKPNGMYVLMYPDTDTDYDRYDAGDYSDLELVFLPIAFFNRNGRNEPIPYNGFIPDNYRPDDLKHDFGVEEDNIKACLEHMVNGSFPALPGLFSTQMKGSVSERQLQIPDDIITSPLYGSTLLPLPKELR